MKKLIGISTNNASSSKKSVVKSNVFTDPNSKAKKEACVWIHRFFNAVNNHKKERKILSLLLSFLLVFVTFPSVVSSPHNSGLNAFSVSLVPDSVYNGDLMSINVRVHVSYHIRSVEVDMDGIETITLSVSSDHSSEQLWHRSWLVQDVTPGGYVAAITMIDKKHISHYLEAEWCVLSHDNSEDGTVAQVNNSLSDFDVAAGGIYDETSGLTSDEKPNILLSELKVDIESGKKESGKKVRVIIKFKEESARKCFTEKSAELEGFGLIKTGEIQSIGVVTGVINSSAIESIRENKDVEGVYPDSCFSVLLDESLPLIRFDQAVSEFDLTGGGTRICILDTGVDSSVVDYSYGYDFVNDDNDPFDDNGHGTRVAAVIDSIAPDAELIIAKVIDSDGTGFKSDVLEGLAYCIDQNPDVICFSIGSSDGCLGFCDTDFVADMCNDAICFSIGSSDGCLGFCDTDFVADMCNDAVDDGIFVVAASGNDGRSILKSPACGSKVFSVGATDDNDGIAGFSNVNPILDLFAPGVDITTIVGTSSGTSMSTPHVAAVALLVLENEDLSPSELKYRLRSTGKPIRYVYNSSLSIDIGRLDLYNAVVNNKTMEPFDYSWWFQGDIDYDEITILIDAPTVVTNATTGIEETNATLHGYLQNDGGEQCTVRFEYGTTINYGTNTSNQTKTQGQTFEQVISGLSNGTLYHYRAFANNSNATTATGSDMTFLTKPQPPASLTATAYNQTRIDLSWTKGDGANTTYIERNTTSSWARGAGTEIYNDSGTSYENTGLTENTTYYYQAWSYTNWTYNPTLDQWSDNNASSSNKTNSLPTITDEIPANQSTGIDLTPEMNITVNDFDGDSMTITWLSNSSGSWTAFGTNSSVGNGTYHQTNSNFSGYNTTYYWSVNVTDGYDWTNGTYYFTTNVIPTQSGESPTNGSTNNSVTPSLHVICSDADGHTMTATWRSNSSGTWATFATNSSISSGTNITQTNSNFSSYNTTYYWSINVTDSYTWTNKTYHFTTMVNQTPVFSNENPSNGSTSVSTSTSTLTITINDPEGDTFNWIIETSPDIGNASSNNATNGSKTCSISGLSASTTYRWYVNATDTASKNWTREWYTFTTAASSSGGGNGGSSGDGWTPWPPPPKKQITSQDTMNDIEQLYGVTLDDPFYATDTNGDDIVDSFTDPNGVLTSINSVYINDNVSFLLSIDDDTIPEFFWDADADTATTIRYVYGTVTGTYIDPVEETVTFINNVDKGDWIYIEAIDQYPPDDFPNYNLIVKTSDNRIISSDMIWRENGKIFVLDDPDVQYMFVYGYDILPASFEPPNGTAFNITMPTIIIAYQEQVQIISAIFGPLNITKQITSSGNEIFTYTLTTRLPSGTYTLSVTVEDADNNSRTDKVTYIINIDQPAGEISWLIISAVGIVIALIAIIIFLRKKKIF